MLPVRPRAAVVEFTVRLLAALVRSENVAVIRKLLPDAVPWVTFLPEPDVDVFVTELVSIARGAAELGNLAPVVVLLTQWRHAAEVNDLRRTAWITYAGTGHPKVTD